MTTFRDIPVGSEFNLDLGVETGLSIDLGKRGRTVYVKRSARTYELLGERFRVGSVSARAWQVS